MISAMSNVLLVDFPSRLDAKKIAEYIEAEIPIEIEVSNSYANPEKNYVSINDFSNEELKALYLVLDKLSAPIESGSYIFNISKSGKSFDLSGSFFRDAEAIDIDESIIPTGTALMMRFEIPGFEINSFREIPLYFNSDFNPADLELLQEIGITLTGNGLEFQIANEVDCKVSFFEPPISEIDYIIDFQMFNEIIPADE